MSTHYLKLKTISGNFKALFGNLVFLVGADSFGKWETWETFPEKWAHYCKVRTVWQVKGLFEVLALIKVLPSYEQTRECVSVCERERTETKRHTEKVWEYTGWFKGRVCCGHSVCLCACVSVCRWVTVFNWNSCDNGGFAGCVFFANEIRFVDLNVWVAFSLFIRRKVRIVTSRARAH